MNAMVNTIENLIPLSEFNKGEAGKIFASVKNSNIAKLVLRRNEPQCVLVSPSNYLEMVKELEDLRDYKMAVERAKNVSEIYSAEEVMKRLNITEKELNDAEDAEFE